MACQTQKAQETIYDFTVKDAKGNDVDLSIYKGKVLLIVNVASKCGMTNSNYKELNQLHEKYKDQGLQILAFPCNQFGEEEPGSNDQIVEFVCSRFKSEFPIFDKIEVNGENSAPLYRFLKSGKWGIFGDDIQWNFVKFLVDKNGLAVDRYYPTTSPLTIEGYPEVVGGHMIRSIESSEVIVNVKQADAWLASGVWFFAIDWQESSVIFCSKNLVIELEIAENCSSATGTMPVITGNNGSGGGGRTS